MCGTPAITTDFGAFTETVDARLRCSTLAEFCDAATLDVDRAALRESAIERFSPSVIGPKYQAYFEKLAGLWGKGWYS
jgi:hypothetical protein